MGTPLHMLPPTSSCAANTWPNYAMTFYVYLEHLPPTPLLAGQSLFSLKPTLNIQIIKITCCNDRLLTTTMTRKLDKYAAVQPFISQQGCNILSPIIPTASMKYTIQNHTVQSLKDLNITPHNTCKLMDSFSQIAIHILYSIDVNSKRNNLEYHWTKPPQHNQHNTSFWSRGVH